MKITQEEVWKGTVEEIVEQFKKVSYSGLKTLNQYHQEKHPELNIKDEVNSTHQVTMEDHSILSSVSDIRKQLDIIDNCNNNKSCKIGMIFFLESSWLNGDNNTDMTTREDKSIPELNIDLVKRLVIIEN